MSDHKILKEYCVGCGLCEACKKAELSEDSRGFSYPTAGDKVWLDKICPIGNIPIEEYDTAKIWGRREKVYYGWSCDEMLRQRASSGGMVSAIASYLLSAKMVDGIIHICTDQNNPTKTIATISVTGKEVFSKCGSRYAISHPLSIISQLDIDKRYVFIGKPCDVVALRNYQKLDPASKKQIPVLLSFFCMGLPSHNAQKKLLEALKTTEENCVSLTYRGNGWPGFAVAVDKSGIEQKIDYDSSWGKILGRDVMPACRFCFDGIGEAADITCADAWYVTKDNLPDFSEKEGRNIVFARTKIGAEILKQMKSSNEVELDEISEPDGYLNVIQKSQFSRRASMSSRLLALKIMGRKVPHYSKEMLRNFGKEYSAKEKMRVLLGSCKRIIKGQI